MATFVVHKMVLDILGNCFDDFFVRMSDFSKLFFKNQLPPF